jgi:hypothetical protein
MDVSAVVLLWNGRGSELPPAAEAVDIGGLSRFDRPQPRLTDYDVISFLGGQMKVSKWAKSS